MHRFRPGTPNNEPLFLDTSALYPYFSTQPQQHDEIKEFFDSLARNEMNYKPLLVNQYVVDELISLLLSRHGHSEAYRASRSLMESKSIEVLSVTDDDFDEAFERFSEYRDHEISLTNHIIAVQARKKNISKILSYDSDFEVLGLQVIPRNQLSPDSRSKSY